MAMTVVVTRNLPDRFRGFLASAMCEIAPGVYTAPRMTPGVRDRLWNVLEDWWSGAPEQAIVMTWPDSKLPGGQQVRTLGVPRTEVCNIQGIFLTRRDLTPDQNRSLTTESKPTSC
jgi:CRISPR-associated protein Cas2